MSRGEFLERVRAGQVNWMWERMGRTEWAISRLNLHTPVCVVPWESHIGLNQGLLAALVTDVAPADRRGTAADCFNVMSGVVPLARVVAGELCDQRAWANFDAGAVFASQALLGLLFQLRRAHKWKSH